MHKHALQVFLGVLLVVLASACTPTRDFHGYLADEIVPADVEPGIDTRSSVLVRLGTPSTKGAFGNDTWIYITSLQERLAYFKPKITARTVVAIRFSDEDVVDEVLAYNVDDGHVIRYTSRETATRGRELGLWEQIFGNVGRVNVLPSENNQ